MSRPAIRPRYARVDSANPRPISPLLFSLSLSYVADGCGTAAPGVETLARSCSICTHHRRDSMDKLLLRGEQLKAVARRYSVSEDALGRHKKHMQLLIAKAAAMVEQKDLAYGSALLAEISRIKADAERLQIESERRQDLRAALKAIHERLAVVELEAKLSGQIETGQKSVTINLQTISPEEALEYARDVFEFFGPGAAPQRELPTPTIDAEPVESSVSHSQLGEGEGE